jgi:hypothetical protein
VNSLLVGSEAQRFLIQVLTDEVAQSHQLRPRAQRVGISVSTLHLKVVTNPKESGADFWVRRRVH